MPKNRKNDSNSMKSTKTSARTTTANVASPPHLEPYPSPCCQGMCAYTKRRSRNAEPIRRPLHHQPVTQERRRLDTPTNQLATKTTGKLQTVRIWGNPVSSCRGPNRSRGRAAMFFSITCLIMYLVYHTLFLKFTLLIPSTGSVRKKVLPIHHSTYSFFLT